MSDLPRADASTIERRRRYGCSATVSGASPAEAISRVERACEQALAACVEAKRSAYPVVFGNDPWTAEWPPLARVLHELEQASERGLYLVAFIREMHEALTQEPRT